MSARGWKGAGFLCWLSGFMDAYREAVVGRGLCLSASLCLLASVNRTRSHVGCPPRQRTRWIAGYEVANVYSIPHPFTIVRSSLDAYIFHIPPPVSPLPKTPTCIQTRSPNLMWPFSSALLAYNHFSLLTLALHRISSNLLNNASLHNILVIIIFLPFRVHFKRLPGNLW